MSFFQQNTETKTPPSATMNELETPGWCPVQTIRLMKLTIIYATCIDCH